MRTRVALGAALVAAVAGFVSLSAADTPRPGVDWPTYRGIHAAGGARRPFHRVRAVFVTGFTALRPFERKLLAAVRESVEEFWIEVAEGDGAKELRTWAAAAAGRDVVTERVEAAAPDAGDEGPTACAG